MLITANLPCCAWAVNVRANARTGHTNTLLFTVRLLISKVIIVYPIGLALECPAYGKTEHGRALDAIGQYRSNRVDGVVIRSCVRKIRSVGNYGRRQRAFETGGIVSPIDAEWRVHHRHQNLKFQPGGGAQLLRTGLNISLIGETRLGELLVQLREPPFIQMKLRGKQQLIEAG